MKKKGTIIILSIMMFILSYLILSQIKTITASNSDILKLQREDDLRDQVVQWREKYETISEKLNQTETKLSEYMNNISQTDKTIELVQNELKEMNIIAGVTDVKGPGVTITLRDAEELNPLYTSESQIVHDTDIQQIVNELRAAGAEAISINEQRVTNLTAIRCVGPTIQVNSIKVGSPFVIKAIGDSQTLYSALIIPSGIVDIMKKYGIQIDVKMSDNVEIHKYEGAIKLKNATVKEE